MRIVFMGTPAAAVPSLARCLADGHNVVAVWTQPDKPAGRGNLLHAPPVKEFAIARGIPVLQPARIKSEEAAESFRSHDANVAVVVAYGRILPAAFLSAPKRGCINLHFSLLPKFRGAAPVNWAIVRGELVTGVTTMLISEGLDTGDILLQRETAIGQSETAPDLMQRLAETGAELLSETLARLDSITPRKQNDSEATYAPVLRRDDGLIGWFERADAIERKVRGFQPWPCAFTFRDDKRLTIWRASAASVAAARATAGMVAEAHLDRLVISCGSETELQLLEVQLEGKRRMSARDFINGSRIAAGERLGLNE